MNAESIDYQASTHLGLYPSNERRVARMYILSDVGCDRDSQNVYCDIVGEIIRHQEYGITDARGVAN